MTLETQVFWKLAVGSVVPMMIAGGLVLLAAFFGYGIGYNEALESIKAEKISTCPGET